MSPESVWLQFKTMFKSGSQPLSCFIELRKDTEQIARFIKYKWTPADKRDLTTIIMLSNMHFKSVKNHHFCTGFIHGLCIVTDLLNLQTLCATVT